MYTEINVWKWLKIIWLYYIVIWKVSHGSVNWLRRSRPRGSPVKLTVYYESLCGDSKRWADTGHVIQLGYLLHTFPFSSFVTDQLHPTFEIFGPEELEVVLKPFGKANVGIVCSLKRKRNVSVCNVSSSLSPRTAAGTSLVNTGPMSARATRCRLASSTRSVPTR